MPMLSPPSPQARAVPAPQRSLIAVPPLPASELASEQLLQGQREILIRHGNECYRLRHTRNDKLILTK